MLELNISVSIFFFLNVGVIMGVRVVTSYGELLEAMPKAFKFLLALVFGKERAAVIATPFFGCLHCMSSVWGLAYLTIRKSAIPFDLTLLNVCLYLLSLVAVLYVVGAWLDDKKGTLIKGHR